jgi:hypothetical protein
VTRFLFTLGNARLLTVAARGVEIMLAPQLGAAELSARLSRTSSVREATPNKMPDLRRDSTDDADTLKAGNRFLSSLLLHFELELADVSARLSHESLGGHELVLRLHGIGFLFKVYLFLLHYMTCALTHPFF